MWDWASALIGFFVGVIFLLILVAISYGTRTFIFTYCPREFPQCRQGNYMPVDQAYQDQPDSFRVNQAGQLSHRRVPRYLCVPGPDQEVIVNYPPVCLFTTETGTEITGTYSRDGVYQLQDGGTVLSTGHCQVQDSDQDIISGIPVILRQ